MRYITHGLRVQKAAERRLAGPTMGENLEICKVSKNLARR